MEGLNIVIADDEALIRLDLREILTAAGHRVVGEAGTGQSAVSLARSKRPDLVIMDVKMPGLDGLAAAKKIKAEKLAPVLLLTAFSQPEFIVRAGKAGVTGYLVKPVTEAQLFPAMEIAVSRWRELRESEQEIESLKTTLAGRKLLDRAKGIIMAAHGLSEDEAYRRLHKYSMAHQQPLLKTAEAVVRAAENGGGRNGTD